MRRNSLRISTFLIFLFSLALVACSDSDRAVRSPDLPAASVQSITVTCAPPTIAVGTTAQCSAICIYGNDVTPDDPPRACENVEWSSDAPGVATVNGSGLVTGVSPAPNDAVTITGREGGRSDTDDVTVTAACVTDLIVRPVENPPDADDAASVPLGLTQQFEALADFNDGRQDVNVTTNPGMSWASGNPAVASIDNDNDATNGPKGRATALTLGASVITGTFSNPAGNGCAATESDTSTMNVTAAVATAMCVQPASAAIPATAAGCVTVANLSVGVGATTQFRAIGFFSDTTSRDVTGDPATMWSALNTNVATVNATGLATGVAVGATEIRAQLGAAADTHPLTVINADPLAVTAAPQFSCVGFADVVGGLSNSGELRGMQEMVLTGFFPDGADAGTEPDEQLLTADTRTTWTATEGFWNGTACASTLPPGPSPAIVGNTAPDMDPPVPDLDDKGIASAQGAVRLGTACVSGTYLAPSGTPFTAGATVLVLPATNDELVQSGAELCATLEPLFQLASQNGGAGAVTQLVSALGQVLSPILTQIAQGQGAPSGPLPTDDIINALVAGLSDAGVADLFAAGLQDVVDALDTGVYAPLNCAVNGLLQAILGGNPAAAADIQNCLP